MKGERILSPTFSSGQVAVIFNKVSLEIFCIYSLVTDGTDIIKSRKKKDRKTVERVRK